MSNPHILERPPVLVYEHVTQLVQGIQPFYHMPKNGVLSIQILNSIRQCYEKLASTTSARLTFERRSDGHRYCAFLRVLKARDEFGLEVSWNGMW